MMVIIIYSILSIFSTINTSQQIVFLLMLLRIVFILKVNILSQKTTTLYIIIPEKLII